MDELRKLLLMFLRSAGLLFVATVVVNLAFKALDLGVEKLTDGLPERLWEAARVGVAVTGIYLGAMLILIVLPVYLVIRRGRAAPPSGFQ